MTKTVCGIELSGSEARVVVLHGTKKDFQVVSSTFRKVSLPDHTAQEQVKSFANTLHQHLQEQGVSVCAIKTRNTKGDHAGGPVSFKLEGLIQLSPCEVLLVHPSTLRSALRKSPLPKQAAPEFKYLQTATELAYYLLDYGD